MRRKWLLTMPVVLVLLSVTLSVQAISGTQAVTGLQDPNGDCSLVFAEVFFELTAEFTDVGGADAFYGILYDVYGTPLSSDDLAILGFYSGPAAIDDYFEGVPQARPFTLIIYDIDICFPGQWPVATVETYPIVASTVFDPADFAPSCATLPLVATEEEETVVVKEPVPGCDVLITIPSTAVGATIHTETPVYWAPGQMSDETFPAGLNVRALGVDESGAYTKVLYVCDYYWIPTNVIGPNYDEVWNGAPLPTTVVE